MFKIILADRDLIHLSKRKDSLESEFKNIKIVTLATTAEKLVSGTLEHKPDLIISNVNLNESFAFYALESLQKHNIKPKVILHSPFISSSLAKRAMELDVDFYVASTISKNYMNALVADILEFQNCNNKYIFTPDDDTLIFKDSIKILLFKLGFKPNIHGTKYIADAVAAGIMNKDLTESVTKILYPYIAKKHNSSGEKIERSIRHALSSTYELNTALFEEILEYDKKPTNSNFIKKCIEHIKETRKDY